MTAAVVWLVLWIFGGAVVTWLIACFSFGAFVSAAEAKDRVGVGVGITLGVIFGLGSVAFGILALVRAILQVVSIFQIALQ